MRLALHGRITLLYSQCVFLSRSLRPQSSLLSARGGIGTDSGCAGCRWVETPVSCEEHPRDPGGGVCNPRTGFRMQLLEG